MTLEQFQFQMQRLESAFGEKHFDFERLDLIKRHIMWMDVGQFSTIVDHFISHFRQYPLPKDFVDAARAERSRGFRQDVDGSVKALNVPWQGGLKAFLAKEYPGCKTIREAVDVQILKNQVARAKE